ncbi:MAG: hypothetical protein KGL39_15630 [Patescibacteria group bacterium]|nr:hypothetical protein [Patescibacteria group bacterium]
MPVDPAILRPGDTLLYFENSTVDWLIAVKTGGKIAHIEIYAGDGMSEASRNEIGVNRYPLRQSGLVCVRRPLAPINWQLGEIWFNKVARGQKYDFKGLLCFYLAVQQGSRDRMFCSEFALRRKRMSGFEPFNPQQDADKTSPLDFWKCGTETTIWSCPTK